MAPVLLQVLQWCWNIWRWKRHIGQNTHIISHPHVRLQTLHILASLCFSPIVKYMQLAWLLFSDKLQMWVVKAKNTQSYAWFDSQNLLV